MEGHGIREGVYLRILFRILLKPCVLVLLRQICCMRLRIQIGRLLVFHSF